MQKSPITDFFGLLGILANSDRNAHWIMGLNLQIRLTGLSTPFDCATLNLMVGFLHRGRVMEARFDGFMLQLRIRARAIDGVMFRREAWDALSGLEKETSCRLCHRAGDPPGGGGRPEFPSPGAVRVTSSRGAEA